ncbi:unnamed protein product [Leuciscus chuanchicus]
MKEQIAGEDTFELHSVQLELDSVEKQIRDLLERQAELRDRRSALETSRADAHKSVVSNLLTPTSSTPCVSLHRTRATRTRSSLVSFTPAPTHHHGPWVIPQRKMRARTRARTSPPLPAFEISTRNRFSPLRETGHDAVIIGTSIVRHVHATSGKGKVRTHCFPGARVLDVAAQVPEILNGDERIGAVVLHAGTNDIRLRQTEVLKKDYRSLIETVRSTSPETTIIVSGPLPTYRLGHERLSMARNRMMGGRGSQAHGTRAKQNPDVGRPSTSSNHSRRGRSGSRRTVSTDSSPGITSSSSWSLPDAHVERGSRESLNLCSRGSDSVEGSWSSDGWESPSEKGLSRSNSLEGFLCPPLPGQVPVEPTETSTGRTAQGAVEASPVNESSTESFESLYNVEQLIGSGGFGRVFLGTRKFDGKKVAIKRMLKSDNYRYLYIPGNPKPLVTEVALLMMMRLEPISPFVIQLYEWFEHPKEFTLVMEYPGHCESLFDIIYRQPWSDWFSRVVMRQAVRAMLHCIHHGVFHSDIHSQNFLFEKDTLDLKLIDFGCGQLFSSEGYESNRYRGVPDYCTPEVFTEPRFHAVPANVWSLGVVLYELSNACLPFRNRTEITQAEVTFQNPNLSKRRSGSWRTVSTDSSPGITSSSSWSLPEAHVERGSRESLNLCSRGSDSVEGSWSSDGWESPSEKGLSRSNSLEGFLCPPLPGQVPVEPTETSTGRTAQGAVEASPVNESSTESFESLYNVEKFIGSGVFGRVFLGTRKFDGKKWPSKRPRVELEEEDDEETLMDTSSVEQDYTFDPAETDTTLTETADMSAQAKWQNETLDRLSERERVIVGGDMRADSPEYLDDLQDLIFEHVFVDPTPYMDEVLKIPILSDLCAEYERPDKEEVISTMVSRFNHQLVGNQHICPDHLETHGEPSSPHRLESRHVPDGQGNPSTSSQRSDMPETCND